MKISLIFNNCNWTTIPDKVTAIKNFFSSIYSDIQVTAQNFTFIDINWVQVQATGGIANTLGTTMTVDPNYFNTHITPLAADADIIVFCLMPQDVANNRTSIGIMQGQVGKVVQCCIFGINENDHAYVNEIDQGNAFVLFVCHEISHALYLLNGISPDNTHQDFYTGQPTKVLVDFQNGKLTKMQQLIALLTQLVTAYKQQLTTIKSMESNTTMTVQFTPKIIKWAQAIQKWEGAKISLNNPGNLKYSTLTASWGGKPGDTAADGGSICQFATFGAGFIALCNFLMLGAQDELKAFHQARTLESFSQIYAGNPPQGYINGIAAILGVPVDIDISTFLS